MTDAPKAIPPLSREDTLGVSGMAGNEELNGNGQVGGNTAKWAQIRSNHTSNSTA